MAAAASSERRSRAAGRCGGSARQNALGQPGAAHGQHQRRQQVAEEGAALWRVQRGTHGSAQLCPEGAQAHGVAGCRVAHVAPEGGAERRVGAPRELGLKQRAPLTLQLGAALLGVHGDQARELEFGVQRGALLVQGLALPDHVGRVGRRAFLGRRAQALEPPVQLGQFRGAARDHALGSLADGADVGQQLAAVVLLAQLLRNRVELLAQLVHRDQGRAIRIGRGRGRRGERWQRSGHGSGRQQCTDPALGLRRRGAHTGEPDREHAGKQEACRCGRGRMDAERTVHARIVCRGLRPAVTDGAATPQG